MENLIMLFLATILLNNVVFNDMASVGQILHFTKDRNTAVVTAVSAMIVMAVSTFVAYAVSTLVLAPLGLEVLNLLVFILIMLVVTRFTVKGLRDQVHVDGFLVKGDTPRRTYESLEGKVTLLSVNSGVLLVLLQTTSGNLGWIEAGVMALATPLALLLGFALLESFRDRLAVSDVPAPFKGFPILLVAAALSYYVLTGFAGIL